MSHLGLFVEGGGLHWDMFIYEAMEDGGQVLIAGISILAVQFQIPVNGCQMLRDGSIFTFVPGSLRVLAYVWLGRGTGLTASKNILKLGRTMVTTR